MRGLLFNTAVNQPIIPVGSLRHPQYTTRAIKLRGILSSAIGPDYTPAACAKDNPVALLSRATLIG